MTLERHCLIHPVVLLKHLLAVESCKSFGAGLGDFDDSGAADETPELADVLGVSDEQVVFGAREKLSRTGIALSCGATEKLAVDSSGAVGFGADHVQAAHFGDAFAEDDV